LAIRSWKNSATRRLFETGESTLRGLDVGRALRRLAELNVITRLVYDVEVVDYHKG
jgi:hypothetical protein